MLIDGLIDKSYQVILMAGCPTIETSTASHTVAPLCSGILWPPHVQNVLVSGCTQCCSHCDIVNQTLKIRHIGYRSAVALSSLHVTNYHWCDNVWHHYRSDTNSLLCHQSVYCCHCLTDMTIPLC